VTIPDGQPSTSITLTSTTDAIVAGDTVVTFTVQPGAYTIGTDSAAVTLTDAEQAILSVADASIAEDGGLLTVTVTLIGSALAPVTVDYATADGSAKTANGDYAAAAGTLSWASGESGHARSPSPSPTIGWTKGRDVRGESHVCHSGATIGGAQGVMTIQTTTPSAS